MEKRRLTLRKKERLYEGKAIEEVFDSGRSIVEHPIRMLWLKVAENDEPVRVGFAVPRKIYKRAVDRNLLKRRMREAYRKNKLPLLNVVQDKKSNYHIMYIYTSSKKASYGEIESKIVVTLQRLIKLAGDK